ncbi:hypothetical protein L9F63_017099, partial [Diploptera punctata]
LLTEDQLEFYKENGFIQLSNIFTSDEIDEISEEYRTLFKMKSDADLDTTWGGEDMHKLANQKKVTVSAIHNLQYHSAVFSRLMMNNNLLDALEDVMDTPDILLHHTKAHLKPPQKGAPYLMHQDYHYFPYKKHSMVAAFVHMEDTTPENGGLAVYPGSHKLGPLKDFGAADSRGDPVHYADPNKYPLSGAKPVYAKKGDVVIFSYLLLHGSYNNESDRTRGMFLMQVRAADDEPTKEVHQSVGRGFVLRGRNRKKDASMNSRFEH